MRQPKGESSMSCKKTKRGFTLVESIICIVIITAISLAALTAALATSDIIHRADDRNKATDQVEMIMACYRTDNFYEALVLCDIISAEEINAIDGDFVVYYNEDFEAIDVRQPVDNNFYCRIEVTVGLNSIGLKAINRASGEVYYKTEEWLG